MQLRRFAVVQIGLFALVLLLGMVGTAAAMPPDRYPPGEEATFVISDACSFDVLLEDLWFNSATTVFYDQEGNERRIFSSGAIKSRLTNMDSGRFIDVNISGPGSFEPQADGSLLLSGGGPWLLFDLYVDELPALALVHGRTELLIDPDGNVEVVSVNGNVEDVCQMLADAG